MPQQCQKLVFGLALVAIALVLFATTADVLPHRHDNVDERVCPICHPPLMGLQPVTLKLPSLSSHSWAVNILVYFSIVASPICHASSRAPPAV